MILRARNDEPRGRTAVEGRPSIGNREGVSAAELENAGGRRAGDTREVSVVDSQFRVVQVSPIECVDEVRSDLQTLSPTDTEALGDREVVVDPPRSPRHIEHVVPGTQRRIRDRTHGNRNECITVQIDTP